MRNKVHSITESRIHGDMYVRFGGRFGETCGSNAVRRSEPSLQ
ncbi:TraG family conjugative transposon ATPase, partial [Bacteroides finegoldii]|nr:TraG family conjugative transposon ATPase [Bacteroides finegoldii]